MAAPLLGAVFDTDIARFCNRNECTMRTDGSTHGDTRRADGTCSALDLTQEVIMQERRVRLPEIILIGATRGMIGFGAGLLLSKYFSRNRRSTVGWALVATGALSTIPLAWRVFRGNEVRPHRVDDRRRTDAAAAMAH
jgi:hypothetical protein